MTGSQTPPSFRLAYVPGVTPSKWVRIWHERLPAVPLTLVPVSPAEACGVLRAGGADAGFVRLPIDGEDLSAIPLYSEKTVVVVPKDHIVAAVAEEEAVSAADLADDIVLHPLDDTLGWQSLPGRPAKERPATTEDAVALVAAGVGVLVVPQSLARLHHRRDLTYRPLSDAPESRVALSWPQERTTDLVEQFIGIVRGRTVNSSRGRPAPAQPEPKRPEAATERRKPSAAAGKAKGTAQGGKGGAKGGAKGKGARSGSGAPAAGRRGKPRRRT